MTAFIRMLLRAAALGLLLGSAMAQAAYPERPITLIVPWGAGGGTDATARIIGTLLEKELGQPVNVVNRTGGSGVVGHSAIAQATPDGYTIGIITVEIGMMHWQGLTELTGASYTPIGLVNADPASVPWVPSNGAAPGLQDMVAGGVQIAPVSLPEARALIDAGKVKSLAVMADAPAALYPNVPTLKAATGSNWTMAAWRGIAAPKNIPPEARDKLVAAIRKIAASKDYTDFMAKQGYGVIYAAPDDFAKFMAKSDADLGATMKAVGIVK